MWPDSKFIQTLCHRAHFVNSTRKRAVIDRPTEDPAASSSVEYCPRVIPGTEGSARIVKKFRTMAIWLVLLVAVVFLVWLQNRDVKVTRPFSDFVTDVANDNVESVEITGNELTITDVQGTRYSTSGAITGELMEKLAEQDVPLRYGSDSGSSSRILLSWIIFLFPVVLLLAFLLYFLRKSKAGSANIMSMRRSLHREISAADGRVTFADVGGCEEAKEALGDVIDFLKTPSRWLNAGVRLPRGILLEGPPGCGKTLLARAVAGETNAKFFLVSGSEFVEMFVGVGAARVRDLFETATKKAPSVVFIDEIDALGRRRGSGIGTSHDEREQTLNQLLVCLDGFRRSDQVVVLAATNRPDILDAALVRPGRIDRRIRVPELSEAARMQVLKIHTRDKRMHEADLQEIARMAEGFNGARLENLCNEAALLAVRRSKREASNSVAITQGDFIEAMQPGNNLDQRFNRLDSLLIESATQLAEPTGTARVRLHLSDAPAVEGDVVWADAVFVKIRTSDGEPIVITKRQIRQIEVLAGTEPASRDEVQMDKWATTRSETA